MGNVIGPISIDAGERFADWFTMREIRDDIKFCRSRDPEKYRVAIDKQTQIYKNFLEKYVHGVN